MSLLIRRGAALSRRRRWAAGGMGLAAAASLAVTAAATGTASASPHTARAGVSAGAPDGYRAPPVKHVWLIILENKSYEATFTGLNKNSYLYKTLTSQGVLLRQYYGTGHYSQDNYLSAVSGQAPDPTTQADCPSYVNVTDGRPAPDGQVYAPSGCVYPKRVQTLFNQLDAKKISWKGYMQSMGNDPAREQTTCGAPKPPAGTPADLTVGFPDPGGAEAPSPAVPTGDNYVPKHNPFPWFHSLLDNVDCAKKVVPLDGLPVAGHPSTLAHPGPRSIQADLKHESTTPAFSWITPDNCSDAHDATCKAPNVVGTTQGGLFAADQFLKKYVPMIEKSPAFQDGGLIDITFDEGFPPYQVFHNSIADLPGVPGVTAAPGNTTNPTDPLHPVNTAQSVVACCNELPGPNVSQPGDQAFGQDTTPGGGITGSVLISRYITPGTISDQPYNHYSWLRSMEGLFGVRRGGSTDGHGHLGFAAAAGLRPFGPDVYNNPSGYIDVTERTPAAPGVNGIFAARAGRILDDSPAVNGTTLRPVPDSRTRPADDPYPTTPFPDLGGTPPGPS